MKRIALLLTCVLSPTYSYSTGAGGAAPGPDYGQYLQLDQVLSCPGLLAGLVDSEAHFVTASQTQEMWFRQILLELEKAQKAFRETKDPAQMAATLKRIISINNSLTKQLPLLKDLVSVSDFFEIRKSFGAASGLQSEQFWRIYARLGLAPEKAPHPHFKKQLAHVAAEPSLFQLVSDWLETIEVPSDFRSTPLPHAARLSAKAQRAVAYLKQNKDLAKYEAPWLLVETLHALDISFMRWRKEHAELTKFYLGDEKGSAGSAGYAYLVRTIEGYAIFGDVTAMPLPDSVSSQGTPISRPASFKGDGMGAFGVSPAQMDFLSFGTTIFNTRKGGSCNVETLSLNPHCHGTHTETVGHIVDDEVILPKVMKSSALVPALLLTISPESAGSSEDTYNHKKEKTDPLITAKSIRRLKDLWVPGVHKALILRTTPVEGDIPPYFSNEAMMEIAALDLDHLLIDTPSVDRLSDDGQLLAHHTYWNVPQGTHALTPKSFTHRTITELVLVPTSISDGGYRITIQIPDFQLSVAPSRPILFPPKP